MERGDQSDHGRGGEGRDRGLRQAQRWSMMEGRQRERERGAGLVQAQVQAGRWQREEGGWGWRAAGGGGLDTSFCLKVFG